MPFYRPLPIPGQPPADQGDSPAARSVGQVDRSDRLPSIIRIVPPRRWGAVYLHRTGSGVTPYGPWVRCVPKSVVSETRLPPSGDRSATGPLGQSPIWSV